MKWLLFALIVISYTTSAIARETPTIALGEKLFNDNNLGSTGNNCATCHPSGKRLEESKAYDDDMLKEMINFCIRDALKGEMLKTDSMELNSLLVYLRGLKN